MKLKLLLIIFCTHCLLSEQLLAQPVYKNKNTPVESRISDLVKRMNLEEKILQLNQYTFGINNNPNNIGKEVIALPPGIGSLIYFSADPELRNRVQRKAMDSSRLGIPILFGFDVIHGFRTVYPISLAQACSFNPDLVMQNCAVAAKESVLSGVDWTFSPMIDVARDPRWGRVSEGYGEDPYMNAVFGVATVKGYQGKNLSDPYSLAACLKHYVAYGMSEGGRDYRYSDVSAQSLWETYLPPYEAGVKAGVATLMSSFNDISGVPATANQFLLTEVLKKRWKHDGFVVSDWNAIEQLIDQGVAKDKKEAGLKAFTAGVEMDMKDNIYFEHFEALLKEQKISMKQIDDAVSRILRVKFRLGLFDEPYTTIVLPQERYMQQEDKAFAAKLAEESMVLLKNNRKVLPFNESVKSIALIGPMAKDKTNMLGSWSFNGKTDDVESIFEGIEKEVAGKIAINYAAGCGFEGEDFGGFKEAVQAADKSDIIVVCLGELKTWSGENASRSSIALPAIQEKLVEALRNTGKPVVLVLSNGRPLELVRLEPLVDAIVEIWQPGIAGGTPLAGILTGRVNPSAKLAITFPLTTGQIPTYYNMRQSARPTQGMYQDIPTEPLYWFGHGLSYTNYSYSSASVSATKFMRNQEITIEIKVRNEGKVKGKETVLWYISDPAATISRPMKELKYFEKKEINAGETTEFKFIINPMRDLSYPDANGNRLLETGEYFIHVGDQKIKIEMID